MSWWDYGSWITEIAHRIPIANPFQSGATDAGQFLTAQNETAAEAYRLGARYVIIDYETDLPQDKFYAMTLWAGKSESEFFEYYYWNTNGTAILLYYPAYYQSMCSRLYNFGGEEVDSTTTYVAQYELYNGYKILLSLDPFPTYGAAEAYIESQTPSNNSYAIVGTNPFDSPVTLDKLDHYKLIYQSQTTVTIGEEGNISAVEIFEYDP
jgi:dolichyl-diphosphooligosaccharide--protein glycosyltransferase